MYYTPIINRVYYSNINTTQQVVSLKKIMKQD